jgi:membrane protein DedA with SNARE-associated domain
VSPSKKANKPSTPVKKKSAQKQTKKSAVRSSRIAPLVAESQIVDPDVRPQSPTRSTGSSTRTNVLRIVALFTVIAITVFIYSIRDRVQEFAEFGYPGIFLIALLANATVLLPAPGVAVVYAMGAIFNPFGVGLAAGTGGAIGELSGYLAGFSGQGVIERTDMYERIKPWVDKYGGWAILVLSAIPNPFFDAAGIAAGIAKMPLPTFLFFTWIGQMIKMTLFALAGKYSINLFTDFFN